jgi:hypothetical protein
MTDQNTPDGVNRTDALRQLRELIAAIDLRVPHIERAGEMAIARDAAVLKKQALARIAQIESAGE